MWTPKTKHDEFPRFFQITSKIREGIPKILSNYFKEISLKFQKPDTRFPKFFQTTSKTKQMGFPIIFKNTSKPRHNKQNNIKQKPHKRGSKSILQNPDRRSPRFLLTKCLLQKLKKKGSGNSLKLHALKSKHKRSPRLFQTTSKIRQGVPETFSKILQKQNKGGPR